MGGWGGLISFHFRKVRLAAWWRLVWRGVRAWMPGPGVRFREGELGRRVRAPWGQGCYSEFWLGHSGGWWCLFVRLETLGDVQALAGHLPPGGRTGSELSMFALAGLEHMCPWVSQQPVVCPHTVTGCGPRGVWAPGMPGSFTSLYSGFTNGLSNGRWIYWSLRSLPVLIVYHSVWWEIIHLHNHLFWWFT